MTDIIAPMTGDSWLIKGDADVQAAPGILASLLLSLEEAGPDTPVLLDLTSTPPTAPALQLLQAARRSLENRGAFAGFGPLAADLSIV
ncbi:hypothetical protein [Frigidibacter mobilis]|uniref:STAS domain-containing protein n=1 Tax=Frigidibacter mobilis TaxID=1335048 RepID=A0A161GKB0_9RHOB|nr:hypothetical protein [Frigidibacter mobilis]AMY70953.1 hypothetical protein AKL17_3730 [Frigidibacter mobilis]